MTLPTLEEAVTIIAARMHWRKAHINHISDLDILQNVWRKLTKEEWDILAANLDSYYGILSDGSFSLAFCAPCKELAQLTAAAIKLEQLDAIQRRITEQEENDE